MDKKIFIILSILVVLGLGGIVVYHYTNTPIFNNPIFTPDENSQKPALIPNNTPQQLDVDEHIEQKMYTVALFGTDERNSEKSRTDTIIVLRYNKETKKMNMISIPRDTLVQIPNKGKDKVNAAYAYGGHKMAVETLEELLQIKIDNYARVNFYSFLDIVDALGGVDVNVEKKIHWYDPDFKKDVTIEPGMQRLTGQTLLTYVRFRKDADGDFGRIKRQREVLLSIANEILTPETLKKLPDLMNVLSKNLDSDVNWKTVLSLSNQISDFSSVQVSEHTLKTHSDKIKGIWFEKIDDTDLTKVRNQLRDLEPQIEGTPSPVTSTNVQSNSNDPAPFFDGTKTNKEFNVQ